MADKKKLTKEEWAAIYHERRNQALKGPITIIAEAAGVQLCSGSGEFISASDADTTNSPVFMWDDDKCDVKSLRFFDDEKGGRYIRYSTDERGNNIDFLINFCGMSYNEAIDFIVDGKGQAKIKATRRVRREKEVKEFRLPPRVEPATEMYRYLMEERALSREIIDFWYKLGLVYQSRFDNIPTVVFKAYDENGKCVFANHRGTQLLNGKKLQRDVVGNNKDYGISIVNDYSNTVDVFEAAIDCMSFMDAFKELRKKDYHNKVVLGGVAPKPLENFLNAHPAIDTIRFCMDNDEPGREAAERLKNHFEAMGYDCYIFTSNDIRIPENATDAQRERFSSAIAEKDWNDFLKVLVS